MNSCGFYQNNKMSNERIYEDFLNMTVSNLQDYFIVCIGVSTPFKNTTSLFFDKPPHP